MLPPLSAVLLTALAAQAWAASSAACSSDQQYNDIPGFPARQSGCYPTNYYRTSDLGQTDPADARQRCQQQCTTDNSCHSVVAGVNKAADSDLYSGTCFFFTSSQTVVPRRCADTAYLLEGYIKDATLSCLSSSLLSASQFCSSYLGVPLKTFTSTSTPSAQIVTVSTTTMPTTTITASAITTPTSTVYTTSTTTMTSATVTFTSSNSVTATATVTSTVISPMTTTTTVTSTTTSTTTQVQTTTTTSTVTNTVSTVTDAQIQKRAASTVPTPACITSGTPATRLSAACSCLSISTSSTTTTTILPIISTTVTSTVTQVMTTTTTTTSAATAVTTTSTRIATASATSTTTTVTTSTSTITTTATVPSTSIITNTATTTIAGTTTTVYSTITVPATATATVCHRTDSACNPQVNLNNINGYSFKQYTCGSLDTNYNTKGFLAQTVIFSACMSARSAIIACSLQQQIHNSVYVSFRLLYTPNFANGAGSQWRCDLGHVNYHTDIQGNNQVTPGVGDQYIYSE